MLNKLAARRPSPALVIAMIALIVALGGTGYAAIKLPKNSVGTRQLKNNAVTGAKVKNKSLTGADINLGSLGKVPSATDADHAANADNATNAASAAQAANATNATNATNASQAATASTATHANAADIAGNGFKAYAHVNADGTVDTANSSNIGNANVALLLTSSYCFHDLSFSFHGAIVTPDHALAIPDKEAAFVAPATTDCSSQMGSQAEVATSTGPDYAPMGFYIVFY